MPRRTKEDNSGWPTFIKNAKEREKSVSAKMQGQRFEDVVLRNKNIDWTVVQKLKRTEVKID